MKINKSRKGLTNNKNKYWHFNLILLKQINFGAQDCSAVDEFGPYTGDINSKMLKDINCKYTLIGHSERRILHKENERIITSKIFSALDSRIIPILCVGEDELQRKNEKRLKLKIQLFLKVLMINLYISAAKIYCICKLYL